MSSDYGTPSEIADSLDYFNEWRRGGDGRPPDPVALGRTIEAAAHKLRDLEREVTHWKANHATEVRRARILKERTDMPMERVAAYEQWGKDLAELEDLRQSFVGCGKSKLDRLRGEGFSVVGLALQKDDKRCWINYYGMVLWPRLETEVSDEKVELANLRREVGVLRTLARARGESSDLYLRKYQELKQRTDELSLLDSERAANAQLTEEVERLRQSIEYAAKCESEHCGKCYHQGLQEAEQAGFVSNISPNLNDKAV